MQKQAERLFYQIRNLIYGDNVNQISNFTSTIFNGTDDLFSFRYEFKQKEYMHGIVVGGNIRCLLKLAGTEYWPDMNQKILLLESLNGGVPQMVTYLNQLKQIGAFDKINGILLGTFTKWRSCRAARLSLIWLNSMQVRICRLPKQRKSDMAFLRKELLLVKRFVCAHAVLR